MVVGGKIICEGTVTENTTRKEKKKRQGKSKEKNKKQDTNTVEVRFMQKNLFFYLNGGMYFCTGPLFFRTIVTLVFGLLKQSLSLVGPYHALWFGCFIPQDVTSYISGTCTLFHHSW